MWAKFRPPAKSITEKEIVFFAKQIFKYFYLFPWHWIFRQWNFVVSLSQ